MVPNPIAHNHTGTKGTTPSGDDDMPLRKKTPIGRINVSVEEFINLRLWKSKKENEQKPEGGTTRISSGCLFLFLQQPDLLLFSALGSLWWCVFIC